MDPFIESVPELQPERTETSILLDWLSRERKHNPKSQYWHLLCKENAQRRVEAADELKERVCEAHQDARERLRCIEGFELDPFGNSNIPDPAQGYPEVLDEITLMGYFGEIMTGLLVAQCEAFELQNWEVPAHLFRFHLDEFRHLEKIRQGHVDKGKKARRVGRTGDDCLAFIMDDDGNITHSLFCEAKCLQTSSENTIKEAHNKLNEPSRTPLDRQQLIEVLLNSKKPDKEKWILALRRLGLKPLPSYQRMNLIGYFCGNSPSPKRKRTSWIPSEYPHLSYSDKHRLEVIEVHISEILELVKQVYGK